MSDPIGKGPNLPQHINRIEKGDVLANFGGIQRTFVVLVNRLFPTVWAQTALKIKTTSLETLFKKNPNTTLSQGKIKNRLVHQSKRAALKAELSWARVKKCVGNYQEADFNRELILRGEIALTAPLDKMQSTNSEDGSVSTEGENVVAHFSKAEHSGGVNEDAFARSENAFAIADGVSSGGEGSAKLARLGATVSAHYLDHLQSTGQLKNMSGEEVKQFIKEKLIGVIKEIKPTTEEIRALSSTTLVALTKVDLGDEGARFIGLGVGDCNVTVVGKNNENANPMYQLERKETWDTGGTLAVFDHYGEFAPRMDDKAMSIDRTVPKGNFVIAASDGLYDNLPGETMADKHKALGYIIHAKTLPEAGEKGSLPTLEDLEKRETAPPTDKTEAAERLRNYLDRFMPTREETRLNDEENTEGLLGKADDCTFSIQEV